MLRYLFEPGFFSSGPVHIALAVGAVVAVTSAVVGVFTVLRGQSFAGHSLADIATTGGSGAFLVGINQFWGYLAFGAGAAAFMEMIGIQRRRGRDVATGVVLGAALGLAALFLYLGTQYSTTTGASFTILFGSIFVITPSTVPALIVSALLALGTVIALARVLLLSSLSPDLAAARGVPVRAVGAAFLMALAVSVALSAVVIGAVLSTALLIGPAATALRVTKGPVRAAAVAAGIGVASTWLGILLAYDSYYWPPAGHGWPVSFFVVFLILAFYLVAQARRGRGARTGAGVGQMFSGFMINTWVVATIVAVVAGAVGFFVVLRGSAFVADALPTGAFAGAAGASLIGVNTLIGLGVFSLLGALGIGWLGRRARHDVAVALALVVMLGLGALFLSFSVEYAPEIYSLLFGEVLGISVNEIAPVAALGAVCIVAI